MDIGTFVIVCMLAALVVMVAALPLLIISRVVRMLKKSIEKLFTFKVRIRKA